MSKKKRLKFLEARLNRLEVVNLNQRESIASLTERMDELETALYGLPDEDEGLELPEIDLKDVN